MIHFFKTPTKKLNINIEKILLKNIPKNTLHLLQYNWHLASYGFNSKMLKRSVIF